jgi:ferrous iron transport protein A
MNLKFVFNPLSFGARAHMLLSQVQTGQIVQIVGIAGQSSFRRRLMELGLVPGTRVELLRVAPLGDPVELLVRGASLSIRKAEAGEIEVAPSGTVAAEKSAPKAAGLEPDLGV